MLAGGEHSRFVGHRDQSLSVVIGVGVLRRHDHSINT